MAKSRRYVRDSRGRFASTGATARGGRLGKTSGKRATVTAKAKGGGKGTISKPKGLKPGTLSPKPQVKPATTMKSQPLRQAAKPRKASGVAKPASVANATKGRRLGGKDQRLEFQNFYHGTSKKAAESIRSGGYNNSGDGFLGKGVYVSRAKKVAGYYANSSQDGGAVLRHRVSRRSVRDVKTDSYFLNQDKSKKQSQAHVKKGRVASLKAADDIQKVALMGSAHANRTLVKSTGTIRRPRRRR